MTKKNTMVVMLIVLALAMGAVGCQKLEPSSGGVANIGPKVLPPIPLEYGELVAVTPFEGDPFTSVFWFQKPDKTITVVLVNVGKGTVWEQATIPRK